MARRAYSDRQRAEAVAAVVANEGNVNLTARMLGIPQKTLDQWVKGTRAQNDETPSLIEAAKGDLADTCEQKVWLLIGGLTEDKIEKAPVAQLTTGIGTLIDKMRLLREQPTGIHEQRSDLPSKAQLAERLRELLGEPDAGSIRTPSKRGDAGVVRPPTVH